MITWLHRLRRDEEGQTLVLGAVFGIILALCVFGTVNLGRAVYEKIQVQTACDNGAYSQAAVEARVLNLTAYTNRAMVVHYSSIMAMSAYLTWLHFTYVFVHGALQIMSWLPYVGEVFAVINDVLYYLMYGLDIAVSIGTPLISAANVVLFALQEGAWNALYLNRLAQSPPESHSGDTPGAPYQPLWSGLVNFANKTVFAQTRGNVILPSLVADAAAILNLSTAAPVVEARLHMLEIANSARAPWVAYGDRYNNPSGSPFARHWAFPKGPCNAQFGVNARTELGSPAPGLTSLWGLQNLTGQIFSGSRMQLSVNCSILFVPVSAVISLFSFTTIDQLFAFGSQSQYQGVQSTGGIVAQAITWVLSFLGLTSAFNGLVGYANSNAQIQSPWTTRLTWISPYVYFTPSIKSGPAGGVTALGSGLGNFGQPDVIFALAKKSTDFNAQAPPVGFTKFNSIIGGSAPAGQVDYSYNGNDWPGASGMPGALQLQPGYNAICAAQVYYHRPGDWKEMPNFFNPLWAARLMPVTESNTGASLGLNNAVVAPMILH